MKKIINVLLIAVCFGMAMPAQAQLKWGLKGGLNMSKASFSGSDFKSDNYTGFFIGPMAEFTIPIIGLGIDGAVEYSQKGIKLEAGNVSESLKQKSIEVPINLKYTIGLGSMLGVFIAAGPQFGFDLNSDEWKFYDEDFSFKKSNFSLNVGVGAKLINHLQVGVNYNIPLGKTAEYDGVVSTARNAFSAKSKTWQVSVAYLF
ncbi:porin family protein [Bacteroides sp.]